MERSERLKVMAESFCRQLQERVQCERLLLAGEQIEVSISIKPCPLPVTLVISDHKPRAVDEKLVTMSLAELSLSVRATNALESEGITTVGLLLQTSIHKLLEIRNFGETTLHEVQQRLAEHGLSLCE